MCSSFHQMDKASLLGDAIAHINHLQEKLHTAELHIKDLQSTNKRDEGSELLARKDAAFQMTKPERNGSSPIFGVYSGGKKCNIAVDILGEEAMIRVTCMRDTFSIVNMMLTLQDLVWRFNIPILPLQVTMSCTSSLPRYFASPSCGCFSSRILKNMTAEYYRFMITLL